MTTQRIEEIKDKIYYEHLEDILAHAELRHLAKDEKQHVDDQRERIHKMLDFIVEIITEAHQAGIDEAVEKMDTLVEQKFPRGERQWCIQCAKRLKKALQENETKHPPTNHTK